MLKEMDLTGKKAIVTGGVTGLGLRIAGVEIKVDGGIGVSL
jgi:NAD(P)-dependent dehydrogenase (short-subunit alcohol dehydrogenase family)